MLKDQCNAVDSHICRFIKAFMSRHVWSYIGNSNSSYEAYLKVSSLYQNSPTQDILQINRRWERLTFKPGFDKRLYSMSQSLNN